MTPEEKDEIPKVVIEYFRRCWRPLKGDFYESSNFNSPNRRYKNKACEVCQWCKDDKCYNGGSNDDEGVPIKNIICCGHPYLHINEVFRMIELNKDKLPELKQTLVSGKGDNYDIAVLVAKDCWLTDFGRTIEKCKTCNSKDCRASKYFRNEGIDMEEEKTEKNVTAEEKIKDIISIVSLTTFSDAKKLDLIKAVLGV